MDEDASAGGGPPQLVVVGLDRRTAGLDLRERLFLDERATRELLERLGRAGLEQALVLSTCDRCEVLAAAETAAPAAAAIRSELAEGAGMTAGDLAPSLYELTGRPALRHLFAVAASLDSTVVGEPQVLGQLKASHRLAGELGRIGPELEAALQAAYAAAKRVRNETAVAEQPVSIAAAAVAVARRVHGDLTRAGALLIGGGEMGELIVAQLRQAGLAHLTVACPSAQRAERTARRLGCHFAPLEGAWADARRVDIVVGALGAGRPVVSAAAVEAALSARRRRPMLLIDAALPGDVEAAVDGLADAFRFDLDALERVAMEGRANRAAAAASGWAVVDEEVAGYLRQRAERQAVTAVVALRRHFEAMREEALAAGGDADTVTRRLVNRLLHDPTLALRQLAGEAAGPGEAAAAEQLLGRLFPAPGPEPAGTDEKE